MENLTKSYIDAGVLKSKIVVSKSPSVCIWSLSRKCLVGVNGIESMEVLDDGNGNKRLSFENNRMVSMQNRLEINVGEINNSNGIIISDAIYGKPYFRFGFIPTE
jgi:hypothetical protein